MVSPNPFDSSLVVGVAIPVLYFLNISFISSGSILFPLSETENEKLFSFMAHSIRTVPFTGEKDI